MADEDGSEKREENKKLEIVFVCLSFPSMGAHWCGCLYEIEVWFGI